MTRGPGSLMEHGNHHLQHSQSNISAPSPAIVCVMLRPVRETSCMSAMVVNASKMTESSHGRRARHNGTCICDGRHLADHMSNGVFLLTISVESTESFLLTKRHRRASPGARYSYNNHLQPHTPTHFLIMVSYYTIGVQVTLVTVLRLYSDQTLHDSQLLTPSGSNT